LGHDHRIKAPDFWKLREPERFQSKLLRGKAASQLLNMAYAYYKQRIFYFNGYYFSA